ncbi:hypothetical protein ACXWO6_10615, partial [Streptococcus pyogenes]
IVSLEETQVEQDPFIKDHLYGCLDVIGTLEIDNALDGLMSDNDRRSMGYYNALQAPALDMSLRGIKVNAFEREQLR